MPPFSNPEQSVVGSKSEMYLKTKKEEKMKRIILILAAPMGCFFNALMHDHSFKGIIAFLCMTMILGGLSLFHFRLIKRFKKTQK